jgi:hypothetical protein
VAKTGNTLRLLRHHGLATTMSNCEANRNGTKYDCYLPAGYTQECSPRLTPLTARLITSTVGWDFADRHRIGERVEPVAGMADAITGAA